MPMPRRSMIAATALICMGFALTACDTSGGEASRALEACKSATSKRVAPQSPTLSDFDSTHSGTQWTVTGRVRTGDRSRLFTCTVDAPDFTNARALLEGDNVPGAP